jgi:hypothetical protein
MPGDVRQHGHLRHVRGGSLLGPRGREAREGRLGRPSLRPAHWRPTRIPVGGSGVLRGPIRRAPRRRTPRRGQPPARISTMPTPSAIQGRDRTMGADPISKTASTPPNSKVNVAPTTAATPMERDRHTPLLDPEAPSREGCAIGSHRQRSLGPCSSAATTARRCHFFPTETSFKGHVDDERSTSDRRVARPRASPQSRNQRSQTNTCQRKPCRSTGSDGVITPPRTSPRRGGTPLRRARGARSRTSRGRRATAARCERPTAEPRPARATP